MRVLMSVILFGLLGFAVEARDGHYIPGFYRPLDASVTEVVVVEAPSEDASERFTVEISLAPLTVWHEENGWGLVEEEWGRGWVDLNQLERIPEREFGTWDLQCHGTEPGWGIEIARDGASFWSSDFYVGDYQSHSLWLERWYATRGTPGLWYEPHAVTFSGAVDVWAVTERLDCINNMSERRYPLRMILHAEDAEQSVFYEGCCSYAYPD